MYRQKVFVLAILLESLMNTAIALTIPTLNSLTQKNDTGTSLIRLSGHSLNLNVTVPLPPVCYFVTDPPMTALSSSKCAFLGEHACTHMILVGPSTRNKWIWSEVSGCALGFYLPQAAAVPSLFDCEIRIFEKMRSECATDWRYNAGAINLFELPDFNQDGTAMVEDEGRFMMAPERLTL